MTVGNPSARQFTQYELVAFEHSLCGDVEHPEWVASKDVVRRLDRQGHAPFFEIESRKPGSFDRSASILGSTQPVRTDAQIDSFAGRHIDHSVDRLVKHVEDKQCADRS